MSEETKEKIPQDHKPKGQIFTKVTVQGHKYKIDPAALDDWELMEDLGKIDRGSEDAALALPRVLRTFFGDEQYRKVINRLRDPETGRVTIEAGTLFMQELFQELNPNS